MKSVLHRRAAINSLKEKTADLILTVVHYITSLCKLFFTLYRIERNRWKELWYLAFKMSYMCLLIVLLSVCVL